VIAWCPTGRLSALGIHDCVIVRSGEETLVVPRARLDELKPFVQSITNGRGRR
jgi:hypothetical protein